MKRKILSVVLCMVMILTIMPKVPVRAYVVLKNLDLNELPLPRCGHTPSQLDHDIITLNNGRPEDHGLEISEISFWDFGRDMQMNDDTDLFVANNLYQIRVKLKPISENLNLFYPLDQIRAKINGRPATIEMGDTPFERVVIYTFDNWIEINRVIPVPGMRYDAKNYFKDIWIMTPDDLKVNAVDFWIGNIPIKDGEYFKENTSYKARIFIAPSSVFPWEIEPVVDGYPGETTYVDGEPNSRCIKVSFKTALLEPIGRIDLKNVPVPKVGERVNNNYTDKNYYTIFEEQGEITDLQWRDVTDDITLSHGDEFKAGHQYELWFKVEANFGTKYDRANIQVTINGDKEATVQPSFEEGSESYLEVTYQFPALPADIKKISKVEVNGILPPELGQQAIVSTTGLTVGSEYDIKKLAWEDANGKELEAGELFQENQTYTIIIDLAAKDGYQFEESANMYGKVNHKPAESLTPLHDNKSNHLSYTFPKLGNLTPPTDFLDVKTSDWVYPNVQSDFLDVKASNWFYPNVQYVVSRGIMNGIGNNMFDPNGKMTRAMIVTMVYRIDGAPSVSGSQDFKDNIEGQWFTDAVRWTYQKELAADFLGNYFEPMANLTREQMITILYNYAKISGKPMTQKDSLSEFADANQLEKYSETPMKWAVHQGIIKGTGANQLNPKGDISRAEVATIIQRFNELK